MDWAILDNKGGLLWDMGMIPKDCFGNVVIITEEDLSIDIHKVRFVMAHRTMQKVCA